MNGRAADSVKSGGAIAHEWIEAAGGAEKVLDAMLHTYPDSDVFALWNDAPLRYPDNQVVESWLSKTSLRRHKALALPLLPPTWRRLVPRREYEWLLVSSHLFAHHARFKGALADIPKFVYAHTPARYLWTPELDARGDSLAVKVAAGALKPLDRRRASEAVAVAANSEFVRARVQRAWNRDAVVIHPPVDVEKIAAVRDWREQLSVEELEALESIPSGFVLGASRFIPYKRLDLVISAGEAAGLPVVIAGRGPEEQRLRDLAATVSVPVRFLISPSDKLLYALYQNAVAFVFPAIEDFGIMPVEAMAAGCPVVVLNIGGAAESVVPKVSGQVVDAAVPEELSRGLAGAIGLDRSLVAQSALRFSHDVFTARLTAWMNGTK